MRMRTGTLPAGFLSLNQVQMMLVLKQVHMHAWCVLECVPGHLCVHASVF